MKVRLTGDAARRFMDDSIREMLADGPLTQARTAQVMVAEVAWRLGREHPDFDVLMQAVTRLNTALDMIERHQ